MGSERYRRTVDRLFAALQLRRTGIVGSGSVVLYLTARRDAYDPFMRAHPSVMDNFVRNQLYGSPFPYGHERGVFDDFALLVVRVATIRLLLIGVAAHEGGLTPELVVEVVQSAERAIGHDVGYHQHVLEVLRRSRALGLPILAALLAVGVEPEQGLEPGAGKRATAVDGGPAHDSSHPRSVLQGSDMPPSGGLIRAELRGLRQSFRLTSRRRLVQLATGAAPTLLRGLRARAVPDGTELAGE
ncbi:MAG: lysine-N-methylase [Chloroflexota bacterium]|nr:lysine-N-methylase [Chloroflexota bacterium]